MPNSKLEKRVKEDLNRLSTEELRRVKINLDNKLKSTDQKKKPSSEESLFYSVLKDTLEYDGYGSCMPFNTFQKRKEYKTFSQKFPVVKEFMQENFPEAKLIERQMIYRTFCRLLINRVNRWEDTEVRISICAVNVDRIPSLVDRAFPGYAKSGLLSMLIKRSYRQDGE